MIPILYESTETEFITNGLHRLYDCTRVEVTEERNGIYECEFDYPVNGPHFDEIRPGRIIAVEHDEKGDVQPFDIYGFTKPINGVITFKAKHISYRLNEMTVIGSGIDTLPSAFAAFAGSSPACPFTFSTNLTSSNYIAAFDGTPRTIRQILGGVEGSILDSYGGEYLWDKFNVSLLSARGQEKHYTIRYGENLLDYQEELDISGIYTAVIPYWTGQDGAAVIGSVVDSGATSYGGRTICLPLDVSDKFESQPTKAQVEAAGASYLASNRPYNPSQNISIDFTKITDTDLEKTLAGLHKFGLCDSVRVVLPMYGIDGFYKIVKVVWDVLLERYTEIELGNLATTLSEALGISTGDSANSVQGSGDRITEQGGSNDWTYRKWASGVLECWYRGVQTNIAIDTAWGALYYKALTAIPDYPVAFVDYPMVTAYLTGTNGNGWIVGNNSNYSYTNPGSLYVVNPSSQSGVNVTINVYAKGRWKA